MISSTLSIYHNPRSPAPLFIDIAGLGYYTHVKRSRHHTSLNSSSPCPLTLIIIRWIVVIHIVMGLQLFVQQSKRTLPTTVLVHYNIIIQSYILLSYRTQDQTILDHTRPADWLAHVCFAWWEMRVLLRPFRSAGRACHICVSSSPCANNIQD